MLHIDTHKPNHDVLYVTRAIPLIQVDKVAIDCLGFSNFRTAPILTHTNRRYNEFTILGMQNLLKLVGDKSSGRYNFF